ncbi:MAG: hypothetical protein RLZZ628_2021 [Bacteroidota bacterium]|jgi:hypothetical protein
MAISVLNKNQIPYLGFASGTFKVLCPITAANVPAAGATTFSFPFTYPVTTSQTVLSTALNVLRNGLVETQFNAIVTATTVTITPVVAADMAYITVGDVIAVEVAYSQK